MELENFEGSSLASESYDMAGVRHCRHSDFGLPPDLAQQQSAAGR
jgi:hypothetical protein